MWLCTFLGFDVYIIYLYRLFTRLSVLICRNLFYFHFFLFALFSIRRVHFLLLFASRNSLNGWQWTYKCPYIFPSAMKYCLLCIHIHSDGHCFLSFLVFFVTLSSFFEKLKINLDCQSHHSDACLFMWFFLVVVFSSSFLFALIVSPAATFVVQSLSYQLLIMCVCLLHSL